MAIPLLEFETHPAVRLGQPGTRVRIREQLLGEKPLRDAIVRERRRADRLARPFAVLVIDWPNHAAEDSGWFPVLSALAAVKRDVDITGWLQHGSVLGLIMHDASPTDANNAVRDMRGHVAKQLGESWLATLSIRVYVHNRNVADTPAALTVDHLVEALGERDGVPWRDLVKRAFDILGSVALIALFLPVLLAVFVFVKLTSTGPALYRQVRVGTKGQPFTMLKFRTMYVNAGHAVHKEYVKWFIKSSGTQPRSGSETFKLTNDSRVTPAGRLLRRTSLDELPQLWNVLRGDMSLVGPRPGLPFEVELYEAWHFRRVLEAKPGVTGLWQVFGRSRTTFDEMVRLDLRYARTRSLWKDIKIIAATPGAMISGKGAC